MSSDRLLRVAILGARGIGRTHARLFHTLNSDVCAVLGSTDATAEAAVCDLQNAFGIRAKPCSRLKELLETSPDAVSICTPPHLHFKQTLVMFDRVLPVFCEKPLFWHKDITLDEIGKRLDRLASHINRRLFVNTSNASLLDYVRDRLPDIHAIELFFFQFYSQGRYNGKDIAVDLLPHGLSLLLRLLGKHEIEQFSEKTTMHNYRCRFLYGRCCVEFDFQQLPGGPKALVFAVNDRTFSRIQETSGDIYRVFLHDSKEGDRVEVEDPFRTYEAPNDKTYLITTKS